MTRFEKILVANRSEIAVRIIRTAKKLGYATVAVYSHADRDAPHVKAADEAVYLGPAPPAQSYLKIEAILAAALASGADAVHPGYGFLAEHAGFARACLDAGLVFIGPSPQAIALMGNKRLARERMVRAGVTVVPGFHELAVNDQDLMDAALDLGLPVMVKAATGGGGRGIRLVTEQGDLQLAIRSARSEAKAAFACDELLIEKAIPKPRHVEVQIFGDRFGQVVHLFERDCSVQRRHQKVVEEAPSPAVDEDLRARLGAAACAAATAVDYEGAGTVEFLLDEEGQFFFLEMNTRLQVEHGVTECITGLDLVAWQLALAQGDALPKSQEELVLTGHAMEVRLYAEDPYASFLPQTGVVEAWRPPPGLRTDHALCEGLELTSYYDSMVAKIIVHASTRERARLRLLRGLAETVLLGVKTNQHFLHELLIQEDFVAGNATTGLISQLFSQEASHAASPLMAVMAAALFQVDAASRHPALLRNWYSGNPAKLTYRLGWQQQEWLLRLEVLAPDRFRVTYLEDPYLIVIGEDQAADVSLVVNGLTHDLVFVYKDRELHLQWGALSASFVDLSLEPAQILASEDNDPLLAAMDGRILAVEVAPGEPVKAGQTLVVLEAMKMEHLIKASCEAVVEAVLVEVGEQVKSRQTLIRIASIQR